MESGSIIFVMIMACVGLVLLTAFSKPLFMIFKFVINSVFGAAGIFAANFILRPLGMAIGINLITVSFVGILGLPGFAGLVLVNAFL